VTALVENKKTNCRRGDTGCSKKKWTTNSWK